MAGGWIHQEVDECIDIAIGDNRAYDPSSNFLINATSDDLMEFVGSLEMGLNPFSLPGISGATPRELLGIDADDWTPTCGRRMDVDLERVREYVHQRVDEAYGRIKA